MHRVILRYVSKRFAFPAVHMWKVRLLLTHVLFHSIYTQRTEEQQGVHCSRVPACDKKGPYGPDLPLKCKAQEGSNVIVTV